MAGRKEGVSGKEPAVRDLHVVKLLLSAAAHLIDGFERLGRRTVVDHIVPHRGDARLFWDEDNWQPLCKSCHDRKTGGGR